MGSISFNRTWSVIKLVKTLMRESPSFEKTLFNRCNSASGYNITGGSLVLKRCFMTSLASRIDSSVNNDEINNGSVGPSEVDNGHTKYKQYIPVTPEEVKEMREMNRNFIPPADAKVLKVAVVGSPNAGKSTIINSLMGWKVCSVSSKVHTTRANASAICMERETQLVLFDTPGVVEMRKGLLHNLDINMILDPQKCISEVDLLAVVVDCANKYTCNKIDPEVLDLLKEHRDIEAVLVLNKIDLLKSEERVLKITSKLTGGKINDESFESVRKISKADDVEKFLKKIEEKEANTGKQKDTKTSWPHFKRVFAVSAETGDGINNFKKFMLQKAKPSTWICHPSLVTDQGSFSIAEMAVREKFLNQFSKEIPYNLKMKVVGWEVNEFDGLEITMEVEVNRASLVRVIVGRKGSKIALVADEAQKDLSTIFRRDVLLRLEVVHNKPK